MSFGINVKGVKICNFTPEIKEIILTRKPTGEVISHCAKINISLENDMSKEVIIPIIDLEKYDWLSLDPHYMYNPDYSVNYITRNIACYIKNQLDSVPKREVYLLQKNGLYRIGSENIYCAGNEIIRCSREINIPNADPNNVITEIRSDNIAQQLDIDPELSEDDAIGLMMELISLTPDTARVIIAYKLGYLMRTAFEEAGVRPCATLYVHGLSGTQKTTYTSYITQTYNRRNPISSPTRLNGSIAAAVEKISGVNDDVIIFDDLCPEESKNIRSNQEELLIEITRLIGDGTIPAKIKKGKVTDDQPKCGIIYTCEYIIGKGSDAARLLPVEMKAPNSKKLQNFQNDPLIVSSFYKYFLKWFVENYSDIVKSLKDWLSDYRDIDMGVHARLQETHFFLNSAYLIFLNYCQDKGYLSYEEAEKFKDSFLELINILVQQQNTRVQDNICGCYQTKDYLAHIREMYRNDKIPYAKSVEQFDERIHAGVIYKDCFCLRGKWLSDKFLENINEIAENLYKQGALVTKKAKSPNQRIELSKQINPLNGKRFYCIPLFIIE